MTPRVLWLSAWLVNVAVAQAQRTAEPELRRSLNDENFAAWRQYVLPNDEESAWERLPWELTFHDGLVAAAKARKPLLLWTMNGHPFGCT